MCAVPKVLRALRDGPHNPDGPLPHRTGLAVRPEDRDCLSLKPHVATEQLTIDFVPVAYGGLNLRRSASALSSKRATKAAGRFL